jgi:hypothetical protein
MNQKLSLEKDKTVIFLHIPKTGGLTLSKIASKNYNESSILSIDGRYVQESVDEFKQLPDEKKRQIKFLEGHASFGLHEYLPQAATYITILREPVNRVISAYYYMLTTPNHPFHNDVAKHNMSFEDFLESKRFDFFNNNQVRMLSGLQEVKYGECSQEMLELAKSNLSNFFSVVGITEKFDEFLILCQRNLGWNFPLYTKVNITKKRPQKEQISEKALSIIEKDNALDINLYKYVKEKLDNSSNQIDLQLHVNFFKISNNIYGQTSVLSPKARYIIRQLKKYVNSPLHFIKLPKH